ncbi:hypothetical protein PTKIN_Ptkin09bG0213100 [Pterospermum kingtungense]
MAQPGLSKWIFYNVKYHVHLLNRMSSNAQPLMVHVRSGDDDLKEHPVWLNGDFQFHFRLSFTRSTLFYCDFKHGNKSKRIVIFGDGYKAESRVCHKTETLYWKVTDDGFYRSCNDQNYVKLHDWYQW